MNEILFRTGIHPLRPANALTEVDACSIREVTVEVLTQAIEHCGTTFSDFQNSKGEIGAYQKFLSVYKREGEPCPKCDDKITRITHQGRSSFYCESCQKYDQVSGS